jgi:DHA1 family bicyclomycin/chloramphenicol resistance-like MFS transporter
MVRLPGPHVSAAGRPQVRFLDRRTPPHIATLILATGLAALSLNIFLPSLTSMADDFGADYAFMQLAVSLYLVATAAMQLALGPISDRYGRRRVMLFAAGTFVLATIGTLIAPNAGTFMVFRILQAAIAAAFVISRAMVRDMVGPDEAASMIGYVTMGMSLVPMVGPVIGGWLDETFGWQASFSLLLAGGLAVTALVWTDLGETAPGGGRSFVDQVRDYPVLFRSRRFWGYTAASAFASGAFFAYLGGAPYVGTEIFRLSPARLGFYFGAPALGYAIGNWIAGRFSVRLGINRMILLGTLVTTGGLGLLALLVALGAHSPPVFFGFIITVGLGNGIALPSANAGLLSVRPELAGTAAGLGGTLTIGGGAALSAGAGWALKQGSGEMPLILLMLLSSVLSVAATVYVIARARKVGA